ncbi:hypothetical protein ACMFMF_002990 [Clarireedia jacksonii]
MSSATSCLSFMLGIHTSPKYLSAFFHALSTPFPRPLHKAKTTVSAAHQRLPASLIRGKEYIFILGRKAHKKKNTNKKKANDDGTVLTHAKNLPTSSHPPSMSQSPVTLRTHCCQVGQCVRSRSPPSASVGPRVSALQIPIENHVTVGESASRYLLHYSSVRSPKQNKGLQQGPFLCVSPSQS